MLIVLTHTDRCFVKFLDPVEKEFVTECDSAVVIDTVTSEPDAEIWFELDNGLMLKQRRYYTTSASIAFKVVQHFIATGEKAPFVSWKNTGENVQSAE